MASLPRTYTLSDGSQLPIAGADQAERVIGDGGLMDPSTLAWLNAGSNLLGRALAPTPNQSSATAASRNIFDSSGWAVDYGAGNASATATPASSLVSASPLPWIIGGIALLFFLPKIKHMMVAA